MPKRFMFSRFIPFVLLLALTILLWIPQGFHDGLTGDAWRYYMDAEQGWLFALRGQFSRPMLPIPWWIGHAITPGSVVGINVLAMLLLFGKGALTTVLLQQFRAPGSLAWAAGLLAIVFPADTGIFYLGALAIHFGAFFFMLSLSFLIAYARKPNTFTLVGLILSLLVSVNTYEVGLVMSLFAPAVLLLVKRPGRDRRFTKALLIWVEVVVLRIGLSLVTSRVSYGYQLSLLDSGIPIPDIAGAVAVIYIRHLVSGWLIPQADVSAGAVLGAVLIGGAAVLLLRRRQDEPSSLPLKWLIVGGAVWIGLATALMLVTSDRYSSLRTYFYSSVGAAVLISAGWYAISAKVWRGGLFAAGCAILIALGTVRLWEQHNVYAEASQVMQQPIIEIASLLGDVAPNTAILLMNAGEESSVREHLPSSWWYLTPILQFAYDDPTITAAYCDPERTEPWGVDREQCILTAQGVQVQVYDGQMTLINHPYDQIIVLSYGDGEFQVVDDLASVLTDVNPLPDSYAPHDRFEPSNLPARIERGF